VSTPVYSFWTKVMVCFFQAFTPMAECACTIIAKNGFKDKIKVIPKRSTDLIVGKGMLLLSTIVCQTWSH